MQTLRQALESLAPEGEEHVTETSEHWAQGRTLYGGMTAALSYQAVMNAHGDLGPLRSAQFCLIGPASGRLRFRSSLLRRGRSSAVVSAECWHEEGIAAQAMFVFGAARESQVTHDRTPRLAAPPPDACESFHKTSKPLKGFLGRFEYRLALGARLFEPDEEPEFAVWARLRDGDEGDPVATLLAFADATPCAAMVNFPQPAPVSTMTWTVDLHRPPPSGGGWRLIWTSSEQAADGYSLQNMRVYDEAGLPLASARQVVAIFA